MSGSGAGSSGDAPSQPPQPDFRTAAMVFQGLGSLSDDDIRVFLGAAGVESSRRMLGLCHSVLMGLDGHYRARIQARDAILQQHHPSASMTTPSPSPSPAPGLGPTSKQASKGSGKMAQPKDSAPPKPAFVVGSSSTSTTPSSTPARTTTPSASTGGGATAAAAGKAAAVPRKTPPSKPATPSAVPGTSKPGVVAQIGKRPPVVPPDPALAACFATPFEDTTAQDLELMVEQPAVAAKAKAPTATPPSLDNSLGYLDLIVPDLEDHMSMSPAPQVFPPVPTTPLSSESEERLQGDLIDLDSDPEEDEPVTVTPWPRDDEEDDDAGPPAPAPQPAAMETQTEPETGHSTGRVRRFWCNWERLLPRQPPPRRLPQPGSHRRTAHPCRHPQVPLRQMWWLASSAGRSAEPRNVRTRRRPQWHEGRGTRIPAMSCRTSRTVFGHCRQGCRHSQCPRATRTHMSKVIVTSGVKPRSGFARMCV